MFQLVLDYPFKSGGQPFDVSRFNNHGIPTSIAFGFDGVEQGSGFFSFNGTNSRVHVPYNKTWDDLVAVRVDAPVRIDAAGKRQIIVEGSYSFSLYIRPDGTVAATYLGPKGSASDLQAGDSLVAGVLGGGGSPDPLDTEAAFPPSTPGAGLEWVSVDTSSTFAPDGIKRTVAPGQWTRVLYVHDTLSMRLYLDGTLAGFRNDLNATVLGVQAAGVHIGASPQGNENVLKGAVDHLRIWKFDPYARQRRFFCRKMDSHTEACWLDLFTAIARARKDERTRDAMEDALMCVEQAEERLIRAIQDHGDQAMQQAADFARQYQELWCEGEIGSEEMKRLVSEWSGWIGETTGNAFTNYLADVMACLPTLQKAVPAEIAARLKTCDPGFRDFLGSLCDVAPRAPRSPAPQYGGRDRQGDRYSHDRGGETSEPDRGQRKGDGGKRQPPGRDRRTY